jgi:hypothetical protein
MNVLDATTELVLNSATVCLHRLGRHMTSNRIGCFNVVKWSVSGVHMNGWVGIEARQRFGMTLGRHLSASVGVNDRSSERGSSVSSGSSLLGSGNVGQWFRNGDDHLLLRCMKCVWFEEHVHGHLDLAVGRIIVSVEIDGNHLSMAHGGTESLILDVII